MAGVRGDGSPLLVTPDDDLNTLISAWEAYDYAISIDNPVMSESSANISKNVYLCRCLTTVKRVKEWKVWKETKEFAEPKMVLEPKEIMEPKATLEPKQTYEGPELRIPIEQLRVAYEELDDRMSRLENTVKKVTPFIKKEQRPDIKTVKTDKLRKSVR